MNELPEEERDAYKRQYYRAQFLKDAYLQEEKRLNRIDELKEKVHQQNLERQARLQQEEKLEHQNKNIEGLPTMQALLDKGMMRRRTKEEIELLKEQRNLNRKLKELQDKENQAQKVLELYHAAANFITTKELLSGEREKVKRQAQLNLKNN